MKIVTTRRISQIVFFLIFLWFSAVAALGGEWWKIRGWPVNLFLQLDPLVGIGTLVMTRTIYAGLLWCLASVVLTILLGRFFCGWVCPFGSIHQFIGFWANRKKSPVQKAKLNGYHRGQSIKYCILIIMLASPVLSLFFQNTHIGSTSLQTGLLDPIPLLYRSVNLVLLPLISDTASTFFASQRNYDGAWSIGLIFFIAIFMNFRVPRFYCRFICPLGALFGILSRFALLRIGTKEGKCTHCHLCEKHCEGACEPSDQIRLSECVLCMNCLHVCHLDIIGYGTSSSSAEISSPDLSRRQVVISLISGVAAIPTLRLDGIIGPNWNPAMIRPPGALDEKEFLSRCIKCGQCMRICPTNVIHPSGISNGLETLWTPVLNFRIGASGCQRNCIACGHVCPVAAIRPLSLDERQGIREYKKLGPVRIGTAFVDQSRCLPWAMDKPCIVCQENCPISPKAISTKEYFSRVILSSSLVVKDADAIHIELEGNPLEPDRYATGDYYCVIKGQKDSLPKLIIKNTDRTLYITSTSSIDKNSSLITHDSSLEIHIRLQRPFVTPERCIGCGVCEHECPVKGRRAIRVTAENESRSKEHALLL